MHEDTSVTDLYSVATAGIALRPLVPAVRHQAVDGSTGVAVVDATVADRQTSFVTETASGFFTVVDPSPRRRAAHVATGTAETQPPATADRRHHPVDGRRRPWTSRAKNGQQKQRGVVRGHGF